MYYSTSPSLCIDSPEIGLQCTECIIFSPWSISQFLRVKQTINQSQLPLSFQYFLSGILKCAKSASYFLLPRQFRILFVPQFFIVIALKFDITYIHTCIHVKYSELWEVVCIYMCVCVCIMPHCLLKLSIILIKMVSSVTVI